MSGKGLGQAPHGAELRLDPQGSPGRPSNSPTTPAALNCVDPLATRSASPSSAEPVGERDLHPGAGRTPGLAATTAQLHSADRYQIINEHGRGGLGRVSRAYDRDLGRDVAIKELISRSSVAEARFLREALITARLEHPGIVTVHEAGRWPDGTPFYAMKLVAGRPLRDLIAERTTINERIGLLHHVIAVADAIAYAHGRHIIHRDLKPANVIVGDFGETVVIDWGLAKDLSTSEDSTIGGGPFRASQDSDLTATGNVLGTPAYMPPEQERGEHVDQRADVFAIGAMLWELCSLQKVPPTDQRLRHRMLRHAGIDRDLIVIVDKALAPSPARRYPDAGALAADLKAFKAGARISARSYSFVGMLAHWTHRHRALAWSTGAALVAAAAIGLFYIRSITVERDRTNGALQRMEAAKNDLVLEHAESLLRSDPTAALAALDGYREGTASPRTELATQAQPLAVTGSGSSTATYELSQSSFPNAARLRRAAQVAADALGRGVATYVLSPNIGTITDLEWGAVNKLLIQGTDDKLVEWQLGLKAPDHELVLAAFSYSSTDARRQWLTYQGSDGVVRLRDLQTKHEVELEHLQGTTWALVMSPAGRHVAAASSTGEIVLWDATPRRLRSHWRPPGVYQALRFSPDSTLLAACGRDGRLAVWSVETGGMIAEGPCDGLANVDFEFTDDSRSLVIGYRSGSVSQLRIERRQSSDNPRPAAAISHGAITEISPGPHSSMLIGTEAGELVLYDPTSTQVIWRIQLASVVAHALYDEHNNLLFAGCSDGHIALVTGSGRSAGVLEGHTSPISAISVSQDSRWLGSGSADGTVRIWSLPVPAVQSIRLASAPIFSAAFSPDGELVAAEAQDGTVSICSADTMDCTTAIAHDSLASGLAWHHDGAVLASSGWDGRLRIWNRASAHAEYVSLSASSGAIYLRGYLKGDQLALLLFQGRQWEVRRIGNHQSTSLLVFDSKSSVAISSDGARLASATTSGILSIWDTSQAVPRIRSTVALGHAERYAPDVTLSPSGRFVVAQFQSGSLYFVTISPQGEATLRLVPNLGRGAPWLAAFSPDEADVGISYSDGRIVTINTETGQETSHRPFADAAAGLWLGLTRLVGVTREGYVWVYDRESGSQCVAHIDKDSILGGALSPTETTLAFAGQAGRLHFFNIASCRWARSSREKGHEKA